MARKKRKPQGKLGRFFSMLLAWGLIRLFGLFSWETADRIGGGLGRALLFFGVRKRVVMENLTFVFGSEATPPERRKTPEQIRRICVGCYENFGRVIVMYLRFPLLTPEFFKERCTCENLDLVDRALEKGRGIVILGGHLGVWEFVLPYATSLGYRLNMIGKNMPNEYMNNLVIDFRKRSGSKFIPPKDSRDKVLKALAAGEVIALVFDQNMTERQGIFVDFFGKPASTVKSTVGIVRDSGAPVMGGILRRVGPARYHMKVYPEIPWIEHGDRDRERLLNTQSYARFIERAILESPEDWFWLHRRWKRRPQDEKATALELAALEKDLKPGT